MDGDPLQVQLAAALAQVAGADDLHGHAACVVLQGDGGADRTVGKGGHRGTGPVIPFKAVELAVEAHAHHQVVPVGLQLVPFCVVGVLIKGQVTAGVCAPELMVDGQFQSPIMITGGYLVPATGRRAAHW